MRYTARSPGPRNACFAWNGGRRSWPSAASDSGNRPRSTLLRAGRALPALRDRGIQRWAGKAISAVPVAKPQRAYTAGPPSTSVSCSSRLRFSFWSPGFGSLGCDFGEQRRVGKGGDGSRAALLHSQALPAMVRAFGVGENLGRLVYAAGE